MKILYFYLAFVLPESVWQHIIVGFISTKAARSDVLCKLITRKIRFRIRDRYCKITWKVIGGLYFCVLQLYQLLYFVYDNIGLLKVWLHVYPPRSFVVSCPHWRFQQLGRKCWHYDSGMSPVVHTQVVLFPFLKPSVLFIQLSLLFLSQFRSNCSCSYFCLPFHLPPFWLSSIATCSPFQICMYMEVFARKCGFLKMLK